MANTTKLQRRNSKPIKRITAMCLAVMFSASAMLTDNFPELFPARVTAVANDGGLSEHVIDTVSPAHVEFNLFDYWTYQQDAVYWQNWGLQAGINAGHPFIFANGDPGRGPWNVWSGHGDHYNTNHPPAIQYGEYKGIVNTLLGDDGFPVLDLDDDFPNKGYPDFMDDYNLTDISYLTESLDYLFDPDIESDYKAVYENVQGLVKYDGNGGYVYNSHENFASFKETTGTVGSNGEASDGYFEVYDNWAVYAATSSNGQFFPFDSADEVFVRNGGNYIEDGNGNLVPSTAVNTANDVTTQDGRYLNHHMGMTMETVFLQPEEGRIDADTPMSFTFSGDDDVWIFIDGVLVSDLGGIHNECFTIIDFETGNVYTGLTPVTSENGSLVEDTPTLEELRTELQNGTDEQWRWGEPGNTANGYVVQTGTFDEFCEAHGIQVTTLRAIFEAAGGEYYDSQEWGNQDSGMSANTFDQNTQHELKMFYLERGAGASNLVLEFNMLAVPASGITKTDQDGNPVEGATFELWPARVSNTEVDEYGNPAPLIGGDGLYIADKSDGEPICEATTDRNGHLNFITDKRKIISFQERAESYDEFYYVLEEVEIPIGYRSNGDISLYYSMYGFNNSEGVLLSYNYWETGAYAQATLSVTMTEDLYEYTVNTDGLPKAGNLIAPPEGSDINVDEYLDNGIIFAVPVKRIDMTKSIYDESNLYALYGTMNTGWTIMHNPITDKESVLEAAKGMVRVMQETRQTGTIIAERNARQLFHLEITNIPGNVKLTYPYLMDSDRVNESEYNIAFYFAPNVTSIDEITDADTIVRIASSTPEDEGGNVQRFERQYASQFYVPNNFNRVRVQKLDYQGNRLDCATFTIYQAFSTWDRDGNGEQYVEDKNGMYRNTQVVNPDGTLKSREEIIQVEDYWDRGTTISEGSTGTGGLDLDGAFIFPSAFDDYVYEEHQNTQPYRVDPNDTSTYLEEGEYVIYETAAPEGYEVNENPINVTVNDDGVFSDAGEINDGIRAGQYSGYIMNSLSTFATEGVVDETLTFINSKLQIIGENGELTSPVEGEFTYVNKYSNQYDRYIVFAEDVGRYITAGHNLYDFTDKGTPRLVIQQLTGIKPQVIVLDGDYVYHAIDDEYEHYNGPVTINLHDTESQSIYTIEGWATEGTIGFYLPTDENGNATYTLESVAINDTPLEPDVDYHVYTPYVEDLSGYDDLSGIFAVETLVQVFDQGYGGLSVTKETENTPDGSALKEDEIFHFRVYSVFEDATKVILAKTNENGEPIIDDATGEPEKVNFNGTLNVRLREIVADDTTPTQETATNIAVDFVDGIGAFYLNPDYNVEYIYIPENTDHEVYNDLDTGQGLMGLVETHLTLSDLNQSGNAEVELQHVAFTEQRYSSNVTFTNGEATLYQNPDYNITQVVINGITFTAGGQNSFTATDRFQYATLEEILNVPVHGEVDAVFTEADGSVSDKERIVVNENLPPDGTGLGDGDVTVYEDGDGYKLAYNMSSDTAEKAVVAQFALHSGQTITVDRLPVGATYYVYEYAVGENGSRNELQDDWDTEIEWSGTEKYEVIDGYRAIRGSIALGNSDEAIQKVTFTNSAHVGQLTISKTVAGDQATDEDRTKKFTFTVTLKDKNGVPLQGTYSYTGSAIDGVTKPADGNLTVQNGQATITLAHGQSITINDIPDDATYEVMETNQDGFTVMVDGDTDNDGDADGTITENITSQAQFTNLKQSVLSFTKVASEDHSQPLAGAEFRLYRLHCNDSDHNYDEIIDPDNPGDCWQQVGSTQTSGDDGIISFGSLEQNSEYRLIETKAPDGRVLPSGQWKITTDGSNRIEIAMVASDGSQPPAFATDETGALLLPNMTPMDIPSSGGWGAVQYMLCGALLMLISVEILLVKKLYDKHKYTASK